jgi:hypothetical protein
MTWETALNRLNRTALGRLGGVSTVVRVGTAETTLAGMFHRPIEKAEFAGIPGAEAFPSVRYITADFEPVGAKAGDIITVGGVQYTITDPPEPDDGGMTLCRLQAYG